ncbi:MAG: hypothetical protein P8Y60_16990 [Calditrichota bacterium]
MERVIFYFDAVLSIGQRIYYGFYGVLMIVLGYAITSDNQEIGWLFWVYVATGIIFITSVIFQPYFKKVFGRRYVMFHNEGLTCKLTFFGKGFSIDRSEIQSVYFHPTSLEIRLKDGTKQQFRYPEMYSMAQDFRSKAVRWVRALGLPWEDWREHSQPAS